MGTAYVEIGKRLDTQVRSKVDEKDQEIANRLEVAYNAKTGLRLGDVIRIGDNLHRLSVRFENGTFQTCKFDEGAFFIGHGWSEHSGGHNHGIHALKNLKATSERVEADYWFFHHNEVQGGGRVDMTMDVRVWELKE